jgi:tetratricopeptide (TPR) repeat protein
MAGLLFFSCTGERQKSVDNIRKLRDKLYSDEKSVNDTALAKELDVAYKDFAVKYPEDTASANFLYQDAQLNQNLLHNIDQANTQYREVFSRFPDHRLAPDALFAFAFNNEQLGRIEAARSTYELFLKKYPENELADDAKNSIKNLGKDPSELIKEFEGKKDSTSRLIQ